MSTSAMKKLQRKMQATQVEKTEEVDRDGEDDETEEINDPDNSSSVTRNRFNVLDFGKGNSDDNEEEASAVLGKEESATSVKHTNKKRKKKRVKRKPDETEQEDFDFDAVSQGDLAGRSTTVVGENNAVTGSVLHATEADLFKVEHRRLYPEEELRKKFGKIVLDADERRQLARLRGAPRRSSTKLVQTRTTWPPFGKIGLSMRLVQNLPGGINVFAYEHGFSYQEAQVMFWEAVESMNPDSFIAILTDCPYHVDTLLQLSDVVRANEDFQMARDCVERALYACECAAHPLFNVTQNNCRLDYKQSENRPFFMALYRHMIYCSQRGCHRTALEFCKLLYNMNPDEDPLGMLLLIDYLALRAEEYDFQISLFHALEMSKNVSMLPNFCYSSALAAFLKSDKLAATGAESALHAEALESATEMMCDAVLKFPTMLIPLLDQCNVEPDPKIAAHPLFGLGERVLDSAGVGQLYALYVARCHALYKLPNVLRWLEDCVHRAIDVYDTSHKELVAEFREIRKSRYQGTPRNVVRHIFLSELKEAISALSTEWKNQPILSYDPLPPQDSRRGYERPMRSNPRMSDSYFSSFLRSLLPNFNPEVDLVVPEEGEGPARAGGGAELQRSVHQLLDAMRNLLRNLQPPPIPRENEPHDEDNDSDWEPD